MHHSTTIAIDRIPSRHTSVQIEAYPVFSFPPELIMPSISRSLYAFRFLGAVVGFGVAVGAFVGFTVGVAVGAFVGFGVGVAVGALVGFAVGVAVGAAVGTLVGFTVGWTESLLSCAPL
jgi:hypothetical protein